MTLGQRISQYRKDLGLSQEALGERLGVSRQAVSKWETDVASPDMENLLALAREFGVSVAELTGTAEPPPQEPQTSPAPQQSRGRVIGLVIALVLILFLIPPLALLMFNLTMPGPADPEISYVEEEIEAPYADNIENAPSPTPQTDFALLWYGADGDEEFLELGEQNSFFPFGTTLELTEPEEILGTDFKIMTTHHADCGSITIDYYHIEEDPELDPESPERESIWSLSTMVSGVRTPRGVHPGSTKAQVLDAYGDDLVYCTKEEGGYTLINHDYYYAFQTPETFGASLQFFMLDGIVAGIRVEHMAELGSTAFAPDNLYRFPLKDGEPDFSLREEPEQEPRSDTHKVYIAWNRLVTDNNLSAEERYTDRWTIFSLLSEMDWQEFGSYGFGGTSGESVEKFSTIEALMSWLRQQAPFTEGETFRLQLGCTAKGLDGAYTDMYSGLLSAAFFNHPWTFVRGLAYEGCEDTMSHAVHLTAYSAELYPAELKTALDELDVMIESSSLTEAELGWAKLLRLYLVTPINDRWQLPKTPAGLQ